MVRYSIVQFYVFFIIIKRNDKKLKKAILIYGIIILTLIFLLSGCKKTEVKEEKYKIVTSFYPIYIMTANIADGAKNVELVNMTDQNVGCIHDYTLSTREMKNVEQANIFIQNGLELENFMDKIEEIYPDIKILNSSENITEYVEDEDEINPHIWTSLESYIYQIEKISDVLIKENPDNREVYEKNAKNYIEEIKGLKEEYNSKLKKLEGKKAICLNEAIDYIAKDLKVDIISIHTDHDESTLSAENLKNIINEMKQENINIILIGKEDNVKNAELISKETGAQIYKINTSLSGETNKDAYINAVKENIEVLANI